jgi:hypothetical protein
LSRTRLYGELGFERKRVDEVDTARLIGRFQALVVTRGAGRDRGESLA